MPDTVCLFKETYLKNLCDVSDNDKLHLHLQLPAIEKSLIESLTHADQEFDADDADEAYNMSYVATSSGFFDRLNADGSDIYTIGWRVLDKRRVIELEVCDLIRTQNAGPAAAVGEDFRTIRIISPMKIREKCLTISEDTRTSSLVIDFITESGFLYTTTFHVDYFRQNSWSPSLSLSLIPLGEENAASWRSIKQPANFDIRSSMMMKAVSFDCLVVSLFSGQIVVLTRENPLDPIYCVEFKDNNNEGKFGLARRWFGASDRVAGYPGLSSKAPISIAVSPDEQFLVTLSLNRSLKLWSLVDLSMVGEVILGSSEDKTLLSPRSMKALEFATQVNDSTSIPSTPEHIDHDSATTNANVNMKNTNGYSKNNKKQLIRSYFVSYLPTLESKFKIWRYVPTAANSADPDASVIQDLGPDFEIDPEQPEDGDLWAISDFRLTVSSEDLQLWVVWKNDKISALRTLIIPLVPEPKTRTGLHEGSTSHVLRKPGTTWVTTDKSQIPFSDYVMFTNSSSEGETEHFLDRIFGPNGFSLKTIETALLIYRSRITEPVPDCDEILANYRETAYGGIQLLKDLVTKVVGSDTSMTNRSRSVLKNKDGSGGSARYSVNITEHSLYRNDLEVQWTRFSKLCEEIERPCHEFSSLGYDSVNNTIYIMKASFLAMVRPLTHTELYYYNRSALPSKDTIDMVARFVNRQKSDVSMILQTVDCFSVFWQFISQPARYNLYNDLVGDTYGFMKYRHLTGERMSQYFDRNLNFLTDSDIADFAKALKNIGHLDTVVKLIYDDFLGDQTWLTQFNRHSEAYNSIAGDEKSFKGLQAIANSLYQQCCVNRLMTLYTLSVCLLSSITDKLLEEEITIFADYSRLIRANDAAVTALSVNTKNSENFFSKFLDSIEKLRLLRTSVTGMGINMALYNTWAVLCNPHGLARIAVDMCVSGLYQQAVEFSNLYLVNDNFSTLIKAHISLLAGEPNSLYMIRDCAVGLSTPIQQFESADQAEDIDMELLSRLSLVYNSFKMFRQGLMNYYYGMASISFEAQNYDFALKLAQDAIQQGDENDKDYLIKAVDTYKLLFRSALLCQDYDQAYDVLMELQYTEQLSQQGLREALHSLMSAMIKSGKGSKFCNYPFIGLAEDVELLLEEITRNITPKDADSKAYYHLMYLWKLEHGDSRGAAEVLYEQLDKVKQLWRMSVEDTEKQAYSQEIIRLYILVVNAMDCIEDDGDTSNKWILYSNPISTRTVLYYDDVKNEYEAYRYEQPAL